MIVRQQIKVVEAVSTQRVYACSTGDVISTSDINGSVIDRLSLGRLYHIAVPFAVGRAVAGSTQVDQKITVAVRLQHGDSSGGGDMADYTTANQPADAIFNTSAMTTPMDAWSTGLARVNSGDGAYSLVAAKQFIRPVITVTLPGNTTATASADNVDVSGGVVLLSPDEAPGAAATGAFSTSTSTST
jgi:hypothetical protein